MTGSDEETPKPSPETTPTQRDTLAAEPARTEAGHGGDAPHQTEPTTTPADPGAAPPTDAEDFATLLAESEAKAAVHRRVAEGDLVQGRVVALGPETAFVAIGAKAEAVINLSEFRDPETGALTLAVGDQIEATVTDDGSRSGSIALKHTLGRGGHVPGELEQAHRHGIAVEGVVTGQNKGGFDVQVAGLRAFCPASQIDMQRSDPAGYVGQRLRFRVTRLESGGRNVVVSRRQLLEEEAAAQAARTWERLREGDIVRGTVTSFRDFGAFVDLGGVEGLIHVGELGHARVGHPCEVLRVGESVEAKVVKLEPGVGGARGRISLSLRALAPDPWTTAAERFRPGTAVRGRVRRLESFGAFVEIAPGLDGLLHVSRIALDRRISHPRQVLQVGDQVDATVVSIDADKRRIGLSMVEQARRERAQSTAAERKETEAALAKSTEAKSLGTLADLLKTATKKKTE